MLQPITNLTDMLQPNFITESEKLKESVSLLVDLFFGVIAFKCMNTF